MLAHEESYRLDRGLRLDGAPRTQQEELCTMSDDLANLHRVTPVSHVAKQPSTASGRRTHAARGNEDDGVRCTVTPRASACRVTAAAPCVARYRRVDVHTHSTAAAVLVLPATQNETCCCGGCGQTYADTERNGALRSFCTRSLEGPHYTDIFVASCTALA